MDVKLCEYIIAIADEGSISAAAEKLYVTQSALNQQLLKLEAELGAPVFVRTRTHWTLTSVGEVYLEGARQAVAIQRDIYARISDLANHYGHMITIGLTSERGMQMFSAIYADIHERYPDSVFQPVEATVEQQNRLLERGQLDIGFQTIGKRKYKTLHYETIMIEPFLLCVPNALAPAASGGLAGDDYPYVRLSDFKDQVFTLVKPSSTMRGMIDDLFLNAGFKPRLLFDSVGMRSMQKLAVHGQCCCIIPRFYATPSDAVRYYRLSDGPSEWEMCAVWNEGRHMNRAARDFISIAAKYWQTHRYAE